MIKMEVSG